MVSKYCACIKTLHTWPLTHQIAKIKQLKSSSCTKRISALQVGQMVQVGAFYASKNKLGLPTTGDAWSLVDLCKQSIAIAGARIDGRCRESAGRRGWRRCGTPGRGRRGRSRRRRGHRTLKWTETRCGSRGWGGLSGRMMGGGGRGDSQSCSRSVQWYGGLWCSPAARWRWRGRPSPSRRGSCP